MVVMRESVWTNKAQCDDAERLYYEKLSGGKVSAAAVPGSPAPGSIAEQISRARQHIKNSLESVDQAGQDSQLVASFEKLQLENRQLKSATEELKKLVISLSERVSSLEGGKKDAPVPEEEDDDEVDLFGSDEEEDDEEKKRITEERLKAYNEKKAKKPKVIAKTSVLFDVKPWDDETDMEAMKEACKGIEMEGLVWGATKLVPVGYGIQKLQIMCTVEDEKVSIEELSEKMEEFEDYVQSVDVAAMNKI